MSFQDENYFLGIPKLPTRVMIFLVPFFLSFIMSGIVAFISTVKSLGMGMHIIPPWLTSWGISWMIAFPTVLFVLPIARRFSLLLVKPAKSND
ncbi:DUF2798 domain-containing protein [Proteus sp. G2618]|uniref:DUF2798 domain-containing protein n=1 Tax=Proteus sp. G2618 TaxID=2698841 RepID=UPI001376E5F3|nr:DUF2798 domain-containing protein [Proteus sp. G2618]NBN72888.1 DUF2798 domain-containing protein [Proteus sp. G2618]